MWKTMEASGSSVPGCSSPRSAWRQTASAGRPRRRVRPPEGVRDAGLHDHRPFGIVVQCTRLLSFLDRATLSWYCCDDEFCDPGVHYYANLDLPAGAVIDYIGVNTATTVDAAMGFTLHFRDHLGGSAQLASATLPTHAGRGLRHGLRRPSRHPGSRQPRPRVPPRRRDRAGSGRLPVLRLRRGLVAPERFRSAGHADVRRRAERPSVLPVRRGARGLGHHREAAESGNYCPDAPLTRGQMAVFLSKALGLHWPE